MKKVAVIDNYDSFTYNLVEMIRQQHVEIKVYRNDEFQLCELEMFDKIILSPGPGLPGEAGLMMQVIERFHREKPILGICLGHQALALFYGAKLFNIGKVVHGKTSLVKAYSNSCLHKNLPQEFEAGRYHSWAVDEHIPDEIEIIFRSEDGMIMGIKHRCFDSYGLQFHPESIMTPSGKILLENFIQLT